jgi:hypothetical protein
MKRPLVHIITSLEIPENTHLISQSILNAKGDLPIDLHWHWLCDPDDEKIAKEAMTSLDVSCESSFHDGIDKHGRINKVLDKISKGFVYFLDSDNLMHPDFLSHFYFLFSDKDTHKFDGMVVEQILEDAAIRKVKPVRGASHPSQIILSRDVIGDLRWHLDAPDADGYFIEQIYDENANSISWVDKPLAFHKKADEYRMLQASPTALQKGCIVVPDKDYFTENIKKSLNPILRATITHLSRIAGLKLKVVDIIGNIVNLLPLRASNPCYKRGNGILLIFETPEHMTNCLKPLQWDL